MDDTNTDSMSHSSQGSIQPPNAGGGGKALSQDSFDMTCTHTHTHIFDYPMVTRRRGLVHDNVHHGLNAPLSPPHGSGEPWSCPLSLLAWIVERALNGKTNYNSLFETAQVRSN